MRVSAHLWTVVPHLWERVSARPPPGTRAFATTLMDPNVGSVTLRGAIDPGSDGETLLVIVHGLGGDLNSGYCVRAATTAARRGWASLRFCLRGADRMGDDFYHAGLTADLEAVLADPMVAGFRRIFVLGFSLGGHMTLRHALRPTDPRVRAVATICAPVDLRHSCEAIDRPTALVYRHHVLAGLKEIYRAVAMRRPVPTPLSSIEAIRTVRDWDERTVAPRHGFDSADHYYAEMSVGPRLRSLALPTLFVATRHDPMVTRETVEPSLRNAPAKMDVRWLDAGGHVGFPPWADLGLPGRGVTDQVLGWLDRQ